MFIGLNATFKEVLILTVQKVLHCMYGAIIWKKVGTGNDFYYFGTWWKSDGVRSDENGRCLIYSKPDLWTGALLLSFRQRLKIEFKFSLNCLRTDE